MTLLRRATALLCGAALFALASPAFAQALTIASPGSLARTDASGAAVEKRPSYFTPEGINLADCTSDLRLLLPVTAQDLPPSARLEVWAGPPGSDCTQAAARAGAAATCTAVLSSLPLASATLSLPMRAVAAAAKPGAAADGSICGAVDRIAVEVEVLALDGEDTVAAATTSVQVDTIGNAAPQAIVDQVQGTVHVTATPTPDTTSTQFAVYCAAADGDGGTCNGSAISYMGTAPDADFDARYRCVTIAKLMAPFDAYVKTMPDGTLFTAGTNVAVRVSSVDAFGNIGPPSAPQCAVEDEVADVGDPTRCSTTPGAHARAGAAWALLAAGLVLAARRRHFALRSARYGAPRTKRIIGRNLVCRPAQRVHAHARCGHRRFRATRGARPGEVLL